MTELIIGYLGIGAIVGCPIFFVEESCRSLRLTFMMFALIVLFYPVVFFTLIIFILREVKREKYGPPLSTRR